MAARVDLTIGEVARRAGVRASAVRYYERARVLPTPRRVNDRRVYDESVLERLKIVSVAQQAGFTLEEIRRLLHGFSSSTPPSARWRALARQKIPEVDALIAQAQGMKRILEVGLTCDCLTLEECALFMAESPSDAP